MTKAVSKAQLAYAPFAVWSGDPARNKTISLTKYIWHRSEAMTTANNAVWVNVGLRKTNIKAFQNAFGPG
jgi:hypothetical protein